MGEPTVRVGLGFDVHAWAVGGSLVLGGVPFDEMPALSAHSDGDVVCHAIADAMLGAAALGDLGAHFRDDDPAFAGLGGLDLLGRVVAIVADAGWTPASCDATVICERPAVAPHRDEMRRRIAAAIARPVERVSVKATRPEGLGLTGDGIGCMAVVTLA